MFAFGLGFGTTVAEPALIAVTEEAARVSAEEGIIGRRPAEQDAYALGLRLSVAVAVGFAGLIGVYRILRGWPIHYLIIGGVLRDRRADLVRPAPQSSALPTIRGG